jgi:hypothetical protein
VDRPDPAAGALAEHQGVLDDLDAGVGGHRGDQRPLDLGSGRVPAGMSDPVPVVSALPGQRQIPSWVAVELGPPGDQLRHLLRTLADQHAHGFLDTQSGPSHQGVVDVLLDGVPFRLDRCDAALRPVGRPGRHHMLGHHHDLAQVAALQGGGQSGNPRADDHDVHLTDPAGRLGGQPQGQPG